MRLLVIAFLCTTLLFFGGCTEKNVSENQTTVTINEVMTGGDQYDWVELYNSSDTPVFLGNWYLSNDAEKPQKWRFPAITLQGGDYLVLYADSTASTPFHLPFRLSASGTSLLLSKEDGTTVQFLQVPPTPSGLSYGINGGIYAWFSTPSIGQNNTNGQVLGKELIVPSEGLRLNEYMTKNHSALYNSDGNYSDWVEIQNVSDRTISLGGYTLSDTLGNAAKWTFPVGTSIEAGGYLLVRCSGQNTVTQNGEIHTNFKLGDDDSFLALYNRNGRFCCGTNIVELEADRSYGYDDEQGYTVFRYPTPGFTNSASTMSEVTS